MEKIDWKHHLEEFFSSNMGVSDYCRKANLKIPTFRYHLYKQKRKGKKESNNFQTFHVTHDVSVFLDEFGEICLRSIDPKALPAILNAYAHAVSQ